MPGDFNAVSDSHGLAVTQLFGHHLSETFVAVVRKVRHRTGDLCSVVVSVHRVEWMNDGRQGDVWRTKEEVKAAREETLYLKALPSLGFSLPAVPCVPAFPFPTWS